MLLPAEDKEIGEVVILKLEDNDGDEEAVHLFHGGTCLLYTS